MAWHKESMRHSLARRGIKTKIKYTKLGTFDNSVAYLKTIKKNDRLISQDVVVKSDPKKIKDINLALLQSKIDTQKSIVTNYMEKRDILDEEIKKESEMFDISINSGFISKKDFDSWKNKIGQKISSRNNLSIIIKQELKILKNYERQLRERKNFIRNL